MLLSRTLVQAIHYPSTLAAPLLYYVLEESYVARLVSAFHIVVTNLNSTIVGPVPEWLAAILNEGITR